MRQETDLSISKIISKVATSYSKYFNQKYDRVGPLFQDRFKAVLVESNEQLLYLSYYVHQNPIKAKLVKNLDLYEYSSYLDYTGKREGTLCKKDSILDQYDFNHERYLKAVMYPMEDFREILNSDLFLDLGKE